MMRSYRVQDETGIHYIEKVYGRYSCLEQAVEYRVITCYCLHYPTAICPAGLRLLVVVFCPAALAAELLVRPSIIDLMAAFQAHRCTSDYFRIVHALHFCPTNFP